MKNILLVCGTGASSGFMAKNIRQAAKARNIEIGVKARSDSVVEDYIEDIDLLLVGPHLLYAAGSGGHRRAPWRSCTNHTEGCLRRVRRGCRS